MATDTTSEGNRDSQPQSEVAYQEMLSLLRNLSALRAELIKKAVLCLRLEPATVHAKLGRGQPLLSGEPLVFPSQFLRTALIDLRSKLPPAGKSRLALDQLLAGNGIAEVPLAEIVADREAYIARVSSCATQAPELAALVLDVLIASFIQKQIEPYRAWIDAAGWRHGRCPVCGSHPYMARLSGDNGRRSLACSLCYTEWTFDRLRCPFCDNTDQDQLRYFTVEGDTAHRVDCCDRCRRYLKTVDERVSSGSTDLLLEDMATAHLDAVALQQGYQWGC